MIEVEEMVKTEIEKVLETTRFGHLACSADDIPYVVPIHYAYKKPDLYIYTTEGKKVDMISQNPNVCVQVEDIVDGTEWKSVIVTGVAEKVTDYREREKIVELIRESNPTLTPAISIRWMDNWIRENREVVYRIKPTSITGRSSLKVVVKAAYAQPAFKKPKEN